MSTEASLSPEEITLASEGSLPRLTLIGGAVAVLGLLASAGLGVGVPARFFHSYLTAFLYVTSLSLGGLFFVLLHHLTRAGWSVVIRRLAEHVAGTLPLLIVLFVPIVFGLHELYHWSHEEAVAHDALLQHKEPWLNAGRFLAGAVIILGSWAVLGWWFRRTSIRQDTGDEVTLSGRMRSLSAPAMLWFAVSLTLASIDWIMSLDPHWYSTIFGVYFFSGSTIGILSVLVLLVVGLQRRGYLGTVITAEHLHDIGKLLFGFTAFWGYIGFSQFMLIWYANIPEETLWYLHRMEHGWLAVTIALAVGHFGLPFFFLLPRAPKRNPTLLRAAAVWLLLMHYVDLYWLVMPGFRPEQGPQPHLLDVTTLFALLGLLVAVFGLLLRGSKLVPVSDPRLAESLSFENA